MFYGMDGLDENTLFRVRYTFDGCCEKWEGLFEKYVRDDGLKPPFAAYFATNVTIIRRIANVIDAFSML